MGNVIENIGKGVGDFVGNIGSGISNATRGLLGGSGSSSPVEGAVNEIRKKQLEMQQAQAGKQGVPMKKGGSVSSASSRADGCCVKGKTRGKMV
jgi:hypothetical protein